jgi:Na+/H+ antiporter NhaD/arsenite permease-like protein
MKIVILITVIESLIIMLAILYFYYRRSQPGKRALVLRRRHVSNTKQAKLVLPSGDCSQRSLPNQSSHSHEI